MKTIAVASGKGGTGKTTVAVALARLLARSTDVDLLDCDVEAPNAHLFSTNPDCGWQNETFTVPRPSVDPEACTVCGACVEVCAFGALAKAGESILVFEELCHACGGCSLVCPADAITERGSAIGTVRERGLENPRVVYGELAIGETLAPPLIREVKRRGRSGAVHVVDAPPGTTCPMVAAVRAVDYAVLVTENTPFGVHDLALAAEVVREMNIPHGVVINRSDIGSNPSQSAAEFCRREDLPVLLEIPFDPHIAATYAAGGCLLDCGEPYTTMLQTLIERVGI